MAERTAQKRRVAPKPPPTEGPGLPDPTPDPAEWASHDLLGGSATYQDTVLPRMNVKVRVRYLDTIEITRLQMLPDYAGYLAMALKLMAAMEGGEAKADDDFDAADATVETVKYQAHVAHRAIVDREDGREMRCQDCGDSHPKSLWTVAETRRLPAADLDHVTAVALQAIGVMAMRPFSKAQPPNGSSAPAASGASIPPTSS